MSIAVHTNEIIYAWLLAQASKHTRKAYKAIFNSFTSAIYPTDPLVARQVHIGAFLKNIRETGGQSRFNQTRSALSSFYDFCIRSGYLQGANPVTAYKTKSISPLKKQFLPNEEIYFRVVSKEKRVRNQIMLHFGYALGLRCFEIACIQVCSFYVGINRETLLRIQGKGARRRDLKVPEWLWKIVAKFIREESLESANYLFSKRTERSRPFSERHIHNIFIAAGKKAGLSIRVGPHKYRKGHATTALLKGASVKSLMDDMGHNSLATLQWYIENAEMAAASSFISAPPEILLLPAISNSDDQ